MAVFKFTSIKELEFFEKVSPKVSDKYVPLYTSKLIEELSPTFTLKNGSQFYQSKNSHYAILSKGSDIELYIENSFDRTSALRISFKYNNFIFGFVKQTHIGASAQEMSTNYDTISDLYESATAVVNSIQLLKFNLEEQEAVLSILFKMKNISKARVINPSQYINLELTAYEYIEHILDLYINGGIEVAPKANTIGAKNRISTPSKNTFNKMIISKRIYDYIKVQFPELYI